VNDKTNIEIMVLAEYHDLLVAHRSKANIRPGVHKITIVCSLYSSVGCLALLALLQAVNEKF
jgi:hypothetical protein